MHEGRETPPTRCPECRTRLRGTTKGGCRHPFHNPDQPHFTGRETTPGDSLACGDCSYGECKQHPEGDTGRKTPQIDKQIDKPVVDEPGRDATTWLDRSQRCPACGRSGLFLADGGFITCSQNDCPSPCAVTMLLAAPARETS